MRTVTRIQVDFGTLRMKTGAAPSDAARELIELLLTEERFIWPEHEPLSQTEILEAYQALTASGLPRRDLPTDPDGHALMSFARDRLGLDPDTSELGLELDAETKLKFDALRHALSILVQIPAAEEADVRTVWRVIEDRQTHVFGLMFQDEDRFTFRLRHHTPDSLKAATERLVNAVSPRSAEAVKPLIEAAATKAIAAVHGHLSVAFSSSVEMKTPASELAQTGDVHVVGSRGGLVAYVGWRSPQRVLLILAAFLLVSDLAFQTFVPPSDISHLKATEWIGGTLGRLTTAAFTAYLFAVLLEYVRLRSGFRRRGAAFIDWGAPRSGTG